MDYLLNKILLIRTYLDYKENRHDELTIQSDDWFQVEAQKEVAGGNPAQAYIGKRHRNTRKSARST